MTNSIYLRTILSLAGLLFAARMAPAELIVGDKAPDLQVGKWIQGEPVQGFDSNHIYVVEFWATWCGPCIQSIPHLNRLWQEFQDKGVIVIGVDVWDADDEVPPFVKKMGTNMTYRVALDDKSRNPDGSMSANWWPRKVNHHGIPVAFIVNRDGVIAWIGHPLGLTEKVLDEIVSGRQDLAKARADYQKDVEIDRQFQDLQGTLISSIQEKKWDDARSALNKIDALIPRMTNSFSLQRLEVLLGQKKFDEAGRLADSLGKSHSTNDFWQNQIAWTILNSEGPDEQCLALAEKAAERGVQLTQGTNTAVLDTLARAQFMQGEKQKAIATETAAANLASNPNEKAGLEKTLASYRDGKLPGEDK